MTKMDSLQQIMKVLTINYYKPTHKIFIYITRGEKPKKCTQNSMQETTLFY